MYKEKLDTELELQNELEELKKKVIKLKGKKTDLKQEVKELKLSNEDLTYNISKLNHEININSDDLDLVKKKYEEKLKDMKEN